MQKTILKRTLLLLVVLSLVTSCTPNVTTRYPKSETSIANTNVSTYIIKGKVQFPQLSLNPSLAKRGTLSGSNQLPSIEIKRGAGDESLVSSPLTTHDSLLTNFSPFTTKALLSEIAPQATVSLIYPSDHSTNPNVTVATGLTDGTGSFIINPSGSFSPAVNSVYILEAGKRIGDAGNALMTLRTYIKWNGTGWDSMTTPGIFINTKTTALAIAQNFNKATVSALQTIGKIDVSTGSSVPLDIGSNPVLIPAQTVTDVANLVTQVLGYNYDPMYYIKFVSGQYKIAIETTPIPPVTANLYPNTTNITTTGFTANWSAIPDCTFDLVVTRVSDSVEVFNQNVGSVNTYSMTLEPGLGYNWKIRAKNTLNNLSSNYTSILPFSTNLDKPVATTANIKSSSFTANWNPITNATGYKLFVDGVQYPNNSTIINTTSYKVQNLPFYTPHNYYVSALNSGSGVVSPNSDTMSLTLANGRIVTTFHSMAGDSNLYGILTDASGNIFTGNDRYVVKISPSGTETIIAGNPVNSGYLDANGTNALFSAIDSLAMDSLGNLFVTDSSNCTIRKIDTSGNVTTFAGTFYFGYFDAQGTNALFNNPHGIVIDSTDNLYVADYYNKRIRKIDPSGNVTTFVGNGTTGNLDGQGTNAQINRPLGMAIDSSGNIYFTSESNRVRKMDTSGNVTTIAGSTAGYLDANGTNAQFYFGSNYNAIGGITVESTGIIYVTEVNNSRIRKIDTSGNVTTFAGSGNVGYQDGIGTDANFSRPSGITVDSAGTIYVGESFGRIIKKIE